MRIDDEPADVVGEGGLPVHRPGGTGHDERPGAAQRAVVQGGRRRLTTTTGTAVTARVVLGADRPVQAVAPVAPPLDVPPPEACAPLALPVELVPFAQHLEYRPAAVSLPLSGGDRAELVAWARFVDGAPVDAARAFVLTDALPPRCTASLAVPTVDLAVTVVADLDREPVDDWVLLRMRRRAPPAGGASTTARSAVATGISGPRAGRPAWCSTRRRDVGGAARHARACTFPSSSSSPAGPRRTNHSSS
ncbi:MAG: hypothetical protein ACLGIG_04455 [Actinomycetes bacterium]